MGIFDRLIKRLAGGKPAPAEASPAKPGPSEPEEVVVPEVTPRELMDERQGSASMVLLDCREPFERRRGHIAGSAHIVMREIPARLAELDREAEIVVYCAHGNRSYGVAGWLIEQGYRARSLRGGIAGWQMMGGEVVTSEQPASPGV